MATMSKVQLLAAQVLKAETLSEAQAFARAISDAESDDEPSAKRLRPLKLPHERHWDCYTSLVTDVCKLLAKEEEEEEGEFKPIAFALAGDRWFDLAIKNRDQVQLDYSLSTVRRTMIFSDSAAGHLPDGVAVAAPPEHRPRVEWEDSGYSVPQDSPDPFVNMFDNYNLKISLLLDAEEFAKIMRAVVGRGHIGREVWAVCSAWAWALLGYRHDPQGMKARAEARKVAARAPSPPSQSIVPYGYGSGYGAQPAQGWSFASGTHSGYG